MELRTLRAADTAPSNDSMQGIPVVLAIHLHTENGKKGTASELRTCAYLMLTYFQAK